MANADREIIERFYAAFAAHDGATMAAAYAPDATFHDPVFPDLRGAEVGGMWRMLTTGPTDLALTLDSLEPGARTGTWIAKWTARYTFSGTGKKVVNKVSSEIELADGKIIAQTDTFDFVAWQAQALGLFATLLGWTGIPARAIRKKAAERLASFMKKA